jgi:membrane-associated protease RseP (regulator of RpoE activity)
MIILAKPMANTPLAFALTIVIYLIRFPVLEEGLTTNIRYVASSFTMPNGFRIDSPAFKTGIRPNDKILPTDGYIVTKFDEIV